jgi:hypothetical protein
MFLLAMSSSRLITAEGYLRNLEFDIYRLVRDTEICVDFQVLRQILKAITKTTLNTVISMEYPVRDNKFLIVQEDDISAAQFYLDTFVTDTENSLNLSGEIVASVKFKDSKIIKHALDIVCHGKSDSEIFLTFSTSRPMLYFTRDDQNTNLKHKVTIPFVEDVESKVTKQMERTYQAKVLKGISGFPKCNMIEMKMHEEGILQIEVSFSGEAVIRHFINPCDI